MAKDPNQSDNKSSPNEIGRSMSDVIEEIGRRTVYRIPEEEKELRRRAGAASESLRVWESLTAEQRRFEDIQKIHRGDVNLLSRAQPRIRIGAGSRIERGELQIMNEIGRRYGERGVNSLIGSMAEMPGVQAASTMYSGSSYSTLQATDIRLRGEINTLRERATNAAEGLYGSQGVRGGAASEIRGLEAQIRERVEQLAPVNVAMRSQRRLGLDPESRMDALQAVVASAGGSVRAESEDVRALKEMSSEELKEKELDVSKKLIDTFGKLAKVVDKSSDEFNHLTAEADSLAETYQNIQAAGGGTGGGGKLGKWLSKGGPWIEAIGTVLNAAGSATMQVGVNQHLGYARNIAGLAGIENMRYQTYKGALGGDAASLLMMSQFGAAEKEGDVAYRNAQIALTERALGGVANVVMGGLKGAAIGAAGGSVIPGLGTGVGAILGAVGGAAGPLAEAITNGFDISRGVTANQAKIGMTQNSLDAVRAVQAIGAEQLQGFMDFRTGTMRAAMGMGSRGDAFMRATAGSRVFTRSLGAAGISPDQYAEMAQFGVNNIGSTFGAGDPLMAQGLARSGLGSAQENLQRMAMLAAGGANNPQAGMGAVLEAALSKSLDGAKVLNMIAQHTGEMSKASTARAMGIDVTGIESAILVGTTNSQDPNKEFAVDRARTVAQIAQGNATDMNTSFSSMMALGNIERLSGVGGISSIMAKQLSAGDYSAILQEAGGDEKKLGALLRGRGIDPNELVPGGAGGGMSMAGRVQQLRRAQAQNVVGQGRLWLAGTGINMDGMLAQLEKGTDPNELYGKMTEKQQTALGVAFTQAGFSNAQEGMRALSGQLFTPTAAGKAEAGKAVAGERGGATFKETFDASVAGNKQLAEAAIAAANKLVGGDGSFVDAIGKVNQAISTLSKNITSTERGAGQWAADRVAGGKGGQMNIDGFNRAVENLSSAAVNLSKIHWGP